ncbi:MAG: hypothetical protein EAX86_05255 [Candidatus Heimdallarchaeota archaeon]|nr:hypothetical protein [Candidatus Heimdallarchaeota archaeon]
MDSRKHIHKILLFSLIFCFLIPIHNSSASDILFYEGFNGLNGIWTSVNGNWTVEDSFLEGIGTSGVWDEFICSNPFFDEIEYTVTFDAYIIGGYGSEQFHFFLDYINDTRVEIGSEPWANHIIETGLGWINLNYSMPLNQWNHVHITTSKGCLYLSINDFPVAIETPVETPRLGTIGFGIYDYSKVKFDELYVYPYSWFNLDPNIIFSDNYDQWSDTTVNSTLYTQINPDWYVENGKLNGFWEGEIWSACTADVSFALQNVTIEFDYLVNEWFSGVSIFSFELTSEPNGRRFIEFYKEGDVWYSVRVDEDEHELGTKISPFPMEGHITIIVDTDANFKIYWNNIILGKFSIPARMAGNIGFGVYNAHVAFDNILIREGQYTPSGSSEPKIPDPTKIWGVSPGDIFEYEITYTGNATGLDLGSWFRTGFEDFEYEPLIFYSGDNLTLKVVNMSMETVTAEVWVNNIYYRTTGTYIFFIPIHNLTYSRIFTADQPYVDYGDSIGIDLDYAEMGLGYDAYLEFRWTKDRGALYRLELTSGQLAATNEDEYLDYFLIKLTNRNFSSDTSSEPTSSNPEPTLNLSPGFNFTNIFLFLLVITIANRRKR